MATKNNNKQVTVYEASDFEPVVITSRAAAKQEEPTVVESFFESKPVRYVATGTALLVALWVVVGFVGGVVSGASETSQKAA